MPESLEKLNERLTALEDRQTIADLIAGYGPAIDALDGDGAAAIWAADGTYDIGADVTLNGRAEIAGIAEMDQHRAYVTKGCAHVLSPHKIVVDGAFATAHGYSVVLLHDASTGGWMAERVSANRWAFRKENGTWQAVTRKACLLDGADVPRALLNWTEPQGNPT
ncbi:nuclear transport factor 2 family protein [Gymnodinialimonas sp. 57CJ19]|uniref:nuclear transport factor 2 family protein n=1 Tax=Gymnodinialimonas sp. 57CJ19 TaxID=3138498 RepID=UPI0031342B1A